MVFSIIAKLNFSVSTITHEPLHLAWWNFACICTATASRRLLNIKVKGHGHVFFCSRDTAWSSWSGFMKCCTGMGLGTLLRPVKYADPQTKGTYTRVKNVVFVTHSTLGHPTHWQYFDLSKGWHSWLKLWLLWILYTLHSMYVCMYVQCTYKYIKACSEELDHANLVLVLMCSIVSWNFSAGVQKLIQS